MAISDNSRRLLNSPYKKDGRVLVIKAVATLFEFVAMQIKLAVVVDVRRKF